VAKHSRKYPPLASRAPGVCVCWDQDCGGYWEPLAPLALLKSGASPTKDTLALHNRSDGDNGIHG